MALIDNIWNQYDSMMKEEKSMDVIETCNSCNNTEFLTDSKEGCTVCVICGLIKDKSLILDTAEWSSYDNEAPKTNMERCGREKSILFPTISSSTIIQGNNNLSKYSKWMNIPYKEMVLLKLMDFLKRKCEFCIPNEILNTAIYLYKLYKENADHKNATSSQRGTTKESMIASCLYYACNKHYIYKTPLEIIKLIDVDSKEFNRGCKLFMEHMKNHPGLSHFFFDLSNPKNLIRKYASKLNQEYSITKVSLLLLQEVQRLNLLLDKTPQSLASSIVFFTMKEFKKFNEETKESDFFSESQCGEVTIIKSYLILQDYKQELFNGIKFRNK